MPVFLFYQKNGEECRKSSNTCRGKLKKIERKADVFGNLFAGKGIQPKKIKNISVKNW